MKRIIKNNYKIMIGFVLGILLSVTSVYAIDAYIESNKVTYKNNNKNNVQEAIDELYEKSGIHQEKWIDPILNGADPVLKSPLIPVEIKSNGDVYYANENSEWYNYSEKRWANAVILIDNPSNKNYVVGNKIEEDDIESYFVWIPRFSYKIWDLGNYSGYFEFDDLKNDIANAKTDAAFWKVAENNSKLIDIKFVGIDTNEKGNAINQYLTHPAFTLGDKDLNGIWVGKFETGYRNADGTNEANKTEIAADKIVIKPNEFSWRNNTVKNMFMTSYQYEKDSTGHNVNLDPHMMKNIEWGAAAYLSHSKYGIGNNVNVNNNLEFKTGYAATTNADQKIYPGITGVTEDKDLTQPWNTPVGYLASTTGNISGVYDMSGGAGEYMAACMESIPLNSDFSVEELTQYMDSGYIDKYDSSSTMTSYNKRILGDATGEMGPFYQYYDKDGGNRPHNSWYGDNARFVDSTYPWFFRGGYPTDGAIAGQFVFNRYTGAVYPYIGFRLVLSPTK